MSLKFTIPDERPAPLPDELARELEASVVRFTERLGPIRVMAEASGWIADYRAEVHRMMAEAYRLGQTAAAKPGEENV